MEQKHKTGTMTRTIALKQIGTPRLVIRPLNEEDVPNIYGIMSDYETASKTGFKPLSSASEAEGFFRESIRSGSAYGMTLKDKPSDIFGIILLTPEELETGAGACTETDKYGFFKVRNNYNDEDELWCVIGDHGAPSLYRGSLVF